MAPLVILEPRSVPLAAPLSKLRTRGFTSARQSCWTAVHCGMRGAAFQNYAPTDLDTDSRAWALRSRFHNWAPVAVSIARMQCAYCCSCRWPRERRGCYRQGSAPGNSSWLCRPSPMWDSHAASLCHEGPHHHKYQIAQASASRNRHPPQSVRRKDAPCPRQRATQPMSYRDDRERWRLV